MSNVKEILERASLDSMIACLLDEPEPVKGEIEVSDNAIEDSYTEFIRELVQLYPEINKDDEELIDAIIRMAAVHEEIYFKAGLIVGSRIAHEIEEGKESLKLW